MTAPFAMNSFLGKRILALVREGDFAHAGEEEAIDLTMSNLPSNRDRRLLDAGCGHGGTAAYLQSRGWGRVTGLDVEPQSITRARETYPHIQFIACDICDVSKHVSQAFDVVTMFNVLYALPDQARALAALASVTTENALLLIFDYVDRGTYQDDPIVESSVPFLPNPLKLPDLDHILRASGWRTKDVRGTDAHYERWYAELVDKIEAKRAAIEALGGADGYAYVHGVYSRLLAALRSGHLGGAIVQAQRAS